MSLHERYCQCFPSCDECFIIFHIDRFLENRGIGDLFQTDQRSFCNFRGFALQLTLV